MFKQWNEKELKFEDKNNATIEISHVINLSHEATKTMTMY